METSKDTLFFNSKVKIERARMHIRELDEELAEYLKTKPFRVVVEKDPESENHLWTLRVKNEPPPQLSEIIGDAAHKLSAALDLMASDLVSMAGGKSKNVYFPFGEDAVGFERVIKLSGIDRAGEDIVELVRSLEPYKGGNELLAAIHNLDGTDRQKPLAASVHYAGVKDFQKGRGNDPLSKVNDAHCGPVNDGTVIISLPPDSRHRAGRTFQPLLRVTFDEEPLTRGRDIVEALNGMMARTEEVIGIFAGYLETRGK